MSKDALRSQIIRNVRDGLYHAPIARQGPCEQVMSLPHGHVQILGAGRPLMTNLGSLLASVNIPAARR